MTPAHEEMIQVQEVLASFTESLEHEIGANSQAVQNLLQDNPWQVLTPYKVKLSTFTGTWADP